MRIESLLNGECLSVGNYVELTVFPLPEFELIKETIYCTNLEPITISAENPEGQYTYEWKSSAGEILGSSPELIVSSGGSYTVIATSTMNCESLPRTVQVYESSIASLSQEDIDVEDGEELNTISINTTNLGIGDYEYALDGNSFQDEPYFDGVSPGIHTVSVRDKNKCGVTSIQVAVIGFQKFFTPNGDGYNDNWQVDGIISQPGSDIYIYDKFGKLLAKIDALSQGWDGNYNGKQMPSSDYWFKVQLTDGRIYTGHFSLIRRG